MSNFCLFACRPSPLFLPLSPSGPSPPPLLADLMSVIDKQNGRRIKSVRKRRSREGGEVEKGGEKGEQRRKHEKEKTENGGK